MWEQLNLGLVLTVVILACLGLGIYWYQGYSKRAGDRSSHSQATEPSADSYFVYQGQELHYSYSPPVTRHLPNFVLIHGLAASRYCYRFVAADLQQRGFGVLAIDLIGFGQSSKDPRFDYSAENMASSVHALLVHLNLQNVVLLGSSMGASIGLYMARLFPQSYPKVVAISPAIGLKRLLLLPIPAIASLAKNFGKRLVGRDFIRKQLENIFTNKTLITEDCIDAYHAPYKDNVDAMLCLIRCLPILQRQEAWQDLQPLTAQVLLIWGEKDRVTPVRHKYRFEKHFPHWQIRIHPSAGHHVQEDEPKWLMDCVQSFLQDS